MKKIQLDQIFERLVSGETVEGWGYTLHRDFVSIFNSSGIGWRRRTGAVEWQPEGMLDREPPKGQQH
ncbi:MULTISPECIES: hypothetical protein [unclassified Devosia]|uniref:hypothetical protein n=1 Tax=unclassified Devosia TaxID=196773 RepID=UPI001AC66344|nr:MULTISPECIES: hypothetical protein [unclassified Devosia]MBN9360858.1 hypothetical protein [Devosia sp.]